MKTTIKTKLNKRMGAWMLTVVLASCLIVTSTAKAQTGIDQTAAQLAAKMVPGWNLGNTLEAGNNANNFTNKGGLGAETAWQNTRTTQEVIDYVKAQGFKSVRIPCAWVMGHISNATDYTIDATWMARVKTIVDYCINDGLYVVLNDHWDGGWLENNITATGSQQTQNKAILNRLWTQIANEFKDYDEHLLFAGLNEPGHGAGNEPTAYTMSQLLAYEQVFVDAVRATGGNNAKRVLVVQGPDTNIDHTCNLMKTMPTDAAANKLMVEVHYYNPWQFWGMENDESWGKVFYYWGNGNHVSGSQHNATWGEESEMRSQLQKMKTNFVDKGIPVLIGEFGANWRNISSLAGESQEKHNASIKAHYRELHKLCKEFGGMVPMVWDINSTYQNGKNGVMTLINRNAKSIFGTPAMEGIWEVYPKPDPSAVSHITTASKSAETPIYTLQGTRLPDTVSLSQLPKGVYLQHGKKIAVSH